MTYIYIIIFKNNDYGKWKINYQEVYDLYQLYSETKDLRQFCADYQVNYDKFMNRQRYKLFIFSLIESCKLNDIDPQDQLKHLFECILHGKECDKKTLLPCFYKSEC